MNFIEWWSGQAKPAEELQLITVWIQQIKLLYYLLIPRRDGSDENMRGRLRDHHNTIKST